jgi:hypothetical protein
MRPEFSEFSYGFALTQEICDLFADRLYAPAFPSLLAEGQTGGGYDVFIPDAAIFLQFKVSDRLTTRAAKESSLLGVPYFRAHLHRRNHSDQHELMLQLENCGNLAFYIAPAFTTNFDFNQNYSARTVAVESTFFAPSEIGPLPDDDPHYVVFRNAGGGIQFCSEPRPIRALTVEQILSHPKLSTKPEIVASREAVTLVTFSRRLTDEMLDIYMSVTGKPIGSREAREVNPVQRAAALAQVLFDCQLVFAGSPNPGPQLDLTAGAVPRG